MAAIFSSHKIPQLRFPAHDGRQLLRGSVTKVTKAFGDPSVFAPKGVGPLLGRMSSDPRPSTPTDPYMIGHALGKKPSIMLLFRVGALVVWRGQVVPIVNRYADKEGAQYRIHTRDRNGALMTDNHVTLGQLMGALNDPATHGVGDKVELGRWDLYIKARWWNFRRGEVLYRVNDALDSGRRSVMSQTELAQRLEAFAVA